MEEFVLINTERMIKFKNHLAIPNEIITLCTDHLWMLQPSDEKLMSSKGMQSSTTCDVLLAKDLNFIVFKPLNFIITLQQIWKIEDHHETNTMSMQIAKSRKWES